MISGEQFGIASGDYVAQIASIGATVRSLSFRGRDLIVPFAVDEQRPFFRGATLAPWPNRVIGGVYEFGGVEQRLVISEPERGHALHGLAAWSDFAVDSHRDDAVTLSTVIEPQQGYPHRVGISVTYSVDGDGLHQTVTGTNLGEAPAPFGTGPHPYLVAGPGLVDDWTFQLAADRVLAVDELLAPRGTVAVDDPDHGDFDFRTPALIGSRFVDHAYTGLALTDGSVTATLTSPAGTGVAMTWDSACPWVQVHTADRPEPAFNRIGLAVEPMTCPPDAFNSKIDLIVLQPGGSSTAGWTISAL